MFGLPSSSSLACPLNLYMDTIGRLKARNPERQRNTNYINAPTKIKTVEARGEGEPCFWRQETPSPYGDEKGGLKETITNP